MDGGETVLDQAGEVEAIIHIARFLELATLGEGGAIAKDGAVVGTGGPTDIVVGVEPDAGFALGERYGLEAIVVDEEVGGAALKFVGGDGGFDGTDCWGDGGG